jgi:predicted esterase
VLNLATEQAANFPEQSHLLYYWRICMAARTGQNELALDLMQEIQQTGFWYGETLLRFSPSLQSLQDNPQFEELINLNRLLRQREESQMFPLLTLRSQERCQSQDEPCPLLIALHANASTAQASLDFWRVAASAGWLVAVPQSSQAMWKGAYVWDDEEITRNEIRKDYASLIAQYAIDPQRTILAGHSMGAEMAMRMALSQTILASGFIAIGPGGPFMDQISNWNELIQISQVRDLRGYIIFGQEDRTIPQENIYPLVEMLNQAGIPTEVEEIPDVEHDFSPEYESSLIRALDFVSEGLY